MREGLAVTVHCVLLEGGELPWEARRVVALAGDSGFLHTGLNALMDAARAGVPLLLIILDNGTTALSGGQPHPGMPADARGRARPAVDLAAPRPGLQQDSVSAVIARGPCPPQKAMQ